MKAGISFALSVFLLALLAGNAPASGVSEVVCGQTITENTTLTADLTCPAGTLFALVIGASGITLDLGGHTLTGQAPAIGIYADGPSGFTIRNGTLVGHNDAVFLTNVSDVLVEQLWIRELSDPDPDHLIRGVNIYRSQRVTVRDSRFEYLPEFHREAVEVYESDVLASDIEVTGGGVGVNFSFAGSCDPLNRPSNGSVRHSRFANQRGMGILLQCSNSTWIHDNVIAPGDGLGVVADGPFAGSVTGMLLEDNAIYGQLYGVQLGSTDSVTVTHNIVHSSIWGIALAGSLGCNTPETGWDCLYPTAVTVNGNQTFGSTTDLFHEPDSQGNTWKDNACQSKEGAEIPTCLPPAAVLFANYPSGKPGSFFTLQGYNFPTYQVAAITINGVSLGEVSTDGNGQLTFLLDGGQASAGYYIVTAATATAAAAAGAAATAGAASASTRITLAARNRLHPPDGAGAVFVIPAQIGLGVLHLPLLLR